MRNGKVWLVGSGPSDEGLFTLKGKEVLEQADVVVYDKLVGQGILSMIPKKAEKIYVGKVAGNHPVPQEEINQILLNKAKEGKRVVRLKGGDPFLFGRGGEELELLVSHHIAFEVVPGVTSAIAVPAYNGIPVTHREYCSSLHIITAHKKRGSMESLDYEKLATLDGTLVFLMGVSALEDICNGLVQAGMDPSMPAAILEKGTTAKQRRVVATLADLPEKAMESKVQTPAIIVVGKVCKLADVFHWAEDRPLGGTRVIVTRPKKVASTFMQKLRDAGAEVIALPAIETLKLDEKKNLIQAIRIIDTYKWIVFSSEEAIAFFFDALLEEEKDVRSLSHIKFAVVGKATRKALLEKGILADYMPQKYDGWELGKGLSNILKDSQEQILLLTPKETESSCERAFLEYGIKFDKVECYQTQYTKDDIDKIFITEEDLVAFTSASTVKGFVKRNKELDYTCVKAICIGEQTAKEARKYKMQVAISKESTIDSLIEKIIEVKKGSVCSGNV